LLASQLMGSLLSEISQPQSRLTWNLEVDQAPDENRVRRRAIELSIELPIG
jgi:hypothetical protein